MRRLASLTKLLYLWFVAKPSSHRYWWCTNRNRNGWKIKTLHSIQRGYSFDYAWITRCALCVSTEGSSHIRESWGSSLSQHTHTQICIYVLIYSVSCHKFFFFNAWRHCKRHSMTVCMACMARITRTSIAQPKPNAWCMMLGLGCESYSFVQYYCMLNVDGVENNSWTAAGMQVIQTETAPRRR